MNDTEKSEQIDLIKKIMLFLVGLNIFVGLYPFYLGNTGALSHMGSAAIVVVMLGMVSVIIGLGNLILMYLLNHENNRGRFMTIMINVISIIVNFLALITYAVASGLLYILILVLNTTVILKMNFK